MPPRKSLDISPEVAALEAKLEKIKADQKVKLGEIVLESGILKCFEGDGDLLLGALTRLKEGIGRNNAGGTFPARPDAATSRPNGGGHADAESARRRPSDLLEGTAPGRTGPRAATEEPEGD